MSRVRLGTAARQRLAPALIRDPEDPLYKCLWPVACNSKGFFPMTTHSLYF